MLGFRAKRSTLDCILDLTSALEHSHDRKRNTLALFLDIKRAYVNVTSRNGVRRLGELGITGRAQAFVRDLVRSQRICVRLGSFLSEKRMPSKGLPQGCVLSSLLFSVVLSDIVPLPVQLSEEVQITVFADNIYLWTSARFNKNLKQRLQAAL